MKTAINFRDFGGLETRHGGRIKGDLLYRSGHMAAVSESAIEHLLGLDFAMIADLRYAGERDHEPSPWPENYAERVYAHGGERTTVAPHLALINRARAGVAAVRQFYLEYYQDLPFNPLYQPLFARVLNGLVEVRGRVLIHCTAGKDRTGTLVALIQHALGVPRGAIIENYLLSQGAPGLAGLAAPMKKRVTAELGADRASEIVDRLLGVEEDYLAAAFSTIEARCGSIDAYLDEAGLTAARRDILREKLVI